MLPCNYSTALVAALLGASALFASCQQESVVEPQSPRSDGASADATHADAPHSDGASAQSHGDTTAEPSKSEADAPKDEDATETPKDEPSPAANLPPETRTVEVIQQVFLSRRQEVRACYEKALQHTPSLRGDLVVQFVLSSRGKLKKVELNRARSTLVAPEVVDCALAVISKFEFPPSSRRLESAGNYPFNFVP